MNQEQDIQGFFLRSQMGSSGEQIKRLGFGFFQAKEPCTVFASGYKEDSHMTRIYFCRPLSAQELSVEDELISF